MSAKRPVPAPCRQQDSNRPVPPSPPEPRVYDHENQQFQTTVAELVALLRTGRDLAEAAGDAAVLEYRCLKVSAEDAKRDRDRILGQYDEAIAKHGGA